VQYHLGIRRLDQAEGDLPKTKPLRWRVDVMTFRFGNHSALLRKCAQHWLECVEVLCCAVFWKERRKGCGLPRHGEEFFSLAAGQARNQVTENTEF
jgi:hypothetical protein